MSVGSMIGGGIRLVRTQPQVVAIWAALYLLMGVVGMIVMRPWMASMMAFQQQAAVNAAAGIKTPPVFPTDLFGQLFVIELFAGILGVIAFAAVVRATIRPVGDRFAYLRIGMDELRLVGLGILVLIAVFVAELVAILGLALIGGLIGVVAGKTVAIGIVAVLAFALIGAAIYAEVRISLAGALTVMRGRIVIKDAWRVTKGRFWTLFGAYLLMSLAFAVAGIVVLAVTNPHLMAAYASFDQQAMTTAAQEQMARQGAGLSAALIFQMAVGAVLIVVMGAVTFGAVATAALELGGPVIEEERPASPWA